MFLRSFQFVDEDVRVRDDAADHVSDDAFATEADAIAKSDRVVVEEKADAFMDGFNVINNCISVWISFAVLLVHAIPPLKNIKEKTLNNLPFLYSTMCVINEGNLSF